MIRNLFLICGLILSLSFANAGTIDPNTDDSKHIEYGKKFEYVGKINGLSKDGKNFYGSCVACADNAIITAAHIASDINSGHVTINNKTLKITKYNIHPLFSKFGKDYDIAICELEDDIGLDWFPELYKEENEINKVCCISGYGITGKFNSSDRKDDQKRRAGSNSIDIVEKHILVCRASQNMKTQLEFLISYGDSGGGLFIDNRLAGINSSIERIYINSVLQNDYQTTGYHVRISSHLDWIENTIKSLSKKESE